MHPNSGHQAFDQDGMPIDYNPNMASGMYQAAQQQQFMQQNPGMQAGYPQQPMQMQQPMQAMNAMPGQPMMVQGAQKSKVVAALLAFFLGAFGVHNFYLGHSSRGIAQLVLLILGVLACATIIGVVVGAPMLIALEIWVFVEFIMLLVGSGQYAYDARGIRLS